VTDAGLVAVGHDGSPRTVVAAPPNELAARVLSPARDRIALVLGVPSKKLVLAVVDLATGARKLELDVAPITESVEGGSHSGVGSVAFAPSGERLAYATPGKIFVHDLPP